MDAPEATSLLSQEPAHASLETSPVKTSKGGTMKHNALRKLYIDELRDLYDAENRLVKVLPRLANASTSAELRAAIEEHLEQTRDQVDRLKEIFDTLGEKPGGKKCAGMIGLIKEGGEIMDADFEGEVMDAAIISAAQRVEHYEIAAYGCVKTWAGLLGESDARALLEKTLDEEKESDRKLTELSERINVEAKGSGGEEDESREAGASRKARAARA
jgi:ferritin-like metal-binding protein YciE